MQKPTTPLSGQEILEIFRTLAPLLADILQLDMGVAVTDTEKFLIQVDGPNVHLGIPQGAPIKPETAVAEAIRTGRPASKTLDTSVYGVPVRVFGYPVFSEEGKILGTIGIARNIEEYVNLEKTVRERTAALEESLQSLNLLKTRQDGDYYLTSLLLRPLMQNRAGGRNVGIDFFLSQYKRFTFRHWNSEIGGDLNLAQTIQLNDRTYHFAVNADAMGKSIQGAGGALVLGTAIRTILDRTSNDRNDAPHPEEFLFRTVQELQNVFSTFDGTMLASAIIALVDEVTGTLYLINAEHPEPVLYRRGRASFLKTRMLRKIGLIDSDIGVDVFSLFAGDIVYFGSDGKDDLYLSVDDEKRVNEDETLFLKHVEQAQGNLDRLIAVLEQVGEFGDDVSLLRIELRDRCSNPQSLRERIRQAVNDDCYEEAVPLLETYTAARPADATALLRLAVSYRRCGRESEASMLVSRLLRRRPDDLRIRRLQSKIGAVSSP